MKFKLYCHATGQFYEISFDKPVEMNSKTLLKARKDLAKQLNQPLYTIDNLCY